MQRFAAALVLFAALGRAAYADPGHDAMRAVAAAFSAAHSFRGTVIVPSGGQLQIDFVAPDRYRMRMPMGEVVVIGGTTYMNVSGQWMQLASRAPGAKDALANLRAPAGTTAALDRAKVVDLGPAMLDGRPMHRWKIETTLDGGPVTSTMWVGRDNLPYRNEIVSNKGRATVLYSGYNSPIAISAPA
ncbi:MAG: hypothetical protein JO359_08030 [Candidatus Eremiobacteraeota bacterium]|nr:hypothetical protein [Candidatus Eremiobacteraeota bacterium]